ncbi:MAG: hypothetical protein GY841_15770 [FCB group bacterium]|nr:hypothetical protein [FCB group bacterium]
MMRFLALLIGMILMTLPKISKTDDNAGPPQVAPKSAIEQLRVWEPPAVVYSLSTIGRNIEHNGESLRCYTVQEGKQVLMPMFADYRSLSRVAWLAKAAIAEHKALVAGMNTKLELKEGMIAFYKDESAQWYNVAQFKKKRLELKERWSWVPWSLLVAGSFAVGIAGITNVSK